MAVTNKKKSPAAAKKPAAKPKAKGTPAKKPAAAKKSAAAKKPAPRKDAPAKKPAAAQKPAKASKETAPQAPAASAPQAEKKVIKRVPPRIIRKPPIVAKPVAAPIREIDTAKAVAFAMAIAQEMKRNAAVKAEVGDDAEIRLSRRPTTRAQGKNSVCFPAADLKEFRRRLIAEREKALSGVDAMKATGFNEAEDHEADGGDGTNQTLRLQALGQMGAINRTIQQIEEALHRIDDGSYGVCTICGQLIRKPRLMNQPFVLTCMECQNEVERSSRS